MQIVITTHTGKHLVLCDGCSAAYVEEIAPLSEPSETSADGPTLTECAHHPAEVLVDGICPTCAAPRTSGITV